MKKTWILAVVFTVVIVVVGAVASYYNSPERKIVEANKALDRAYQSTQQAYDEYEELQERLERIEELQEALGY